MGRHTSLLPLLACLLLAASATTPSWPDADADSACPTDPEAAATRLRDSVVSLHLLFIGPLARSVVDDLMSGLQVIRADGAVCADWGTSLIDSTFQHDPGLLPLTVSVCAKAIHSPPSLAADDHHASQQDHTAAAPQPDPHTRPPTPLPAFAAGGLFSIDGIRTRLENLFGSREGDDTEVSRVPDPATAEDTEDGAPRAATRHPDAVVLVESVQRYALAVNRTVVARSLLDWCLDLLPRERVAVEVDPSQVSALRNVSLDVEAYHAGFGALLSTPPVVFFPDAHLLRPPSFGATLRARLSEHFPEVLLMSLRRRSKGGGGRAAFSLAAVVRRMYERDPFPPGRAGDALAKVLRDVYSRKFLGAAADFRVAQRCQEEQQLRQGVSERDALERREYQERVDSLARLRRVFGEEMGELDEWEWGACVTRVCVSVGSLVAAGLLLAASTRLLRPVFLRIALLDRVSSVFSVVMPLAATLARTWHFLNAPPTPMVKPSKKVTLDETETMYVKRTQSIKTALNRTMNVVLATVRGRRKSLKGNKPVLTPVVPNLPPGTPGPAKWKSPPAPVTITQIASPSDFNLSGSTFPGLQAASTFKSDQTEDHESDHESRRVHSRRRVSVVSTEEPVLMRQSSMTSTSSTAYLLQQHVDRESSRHVSDLSSFRAFRRNSNGTSAEPAKQSMSRQSMSSVSPSHGPVLMAATSSSQPLSRESTDLSLNVMARLSGVAAAARKRNRMRRNIDYLVKPQTPARADSEHPGFPTPVSPQGAVHPFAAAASEAATPASPTRSHLADVGRSMMSMLWPRSNPSSPARPDAAVQQQPSSPREVSTTPPPSAPVPTPAASAFQDREPPQSEAGRELLAMASSATAGGVAFKPIEAAGGAAFTSGTEWSRDSVHEALLTPIRDALAPASPAVPHVVHQVHSRRTSVSSAGMAALGLHPTQSSGSQARTVNGAAEAAAVGLARTSSRSSMRSDLRPSFCGDPLSQGMKQMSERGSQASYKSAGTSVKDPLSATLQDLASNAAMSHPADSDDGHAGL